MGYLANAKAYLAATMLLLAARYDDAQPTESAIDCLSDIVRRSRCRRLEIQVAMAPPPPALDEETLEWHANPANGPAPRPPTPCSPTLNKLLQLDSDSVLFEDSTDLDPNLGRPWDDDEDPLDHVKGTDDYSINWSAESP
jgi:hypothetical protein